MSVVTSAIILVEYAPREVLEMLIKNHTFGRDEEHLQGFRQLDDSLAGGGKMFQSQIYAAGFNHINRDILVKWFRKLPWGTASSAALLYDCEGEDHTIVTIGNWRIET